MNQKAGEVRQALGDAVLLAGLTPNHPAHPAGDGGAEALKVAATTVPTFKAGAGFKAPVAPKKKAKK